MIHPTSVPQRLAGSVGIVTGAAGAIGGAAARAFRDNGAVVGLLDRASSTLDELAEEFGDSGVPLAVDITDENQFRTAMAGWADRFGRADFVYVCAGIQLHGLDGPVGEVSLETWQRTIEVNLTGAFLSVKHTIDLLSAARSGSLILCGSPTGLTMCGSGYAAYAASKAGMMTLARTVAADYGHAGVRANVIVPGATRSPLIATLTSDAGRYEQLLAGIPVGRLGTPDDLVGVAVFLASDESRYATGANFCIDGGMTLR